MASSSKWIEGIGPETSVEDAAQRSLEPRLAAVAHYLPMAAHLAEHDDEHVHRLRVATRRAVAALKLYQKLLPVKPARWLKKRLRNIRRAAGDARDLDVLVKRLAEDYGDRAAPIVELAKKERATVQPAIVHIAGRCSHEDRYIRKTAKLLEGIQLPKPSDSSQQRPVEFGCWATEQLSKVANRFLDAMPDEASDVVALHQFRIRAKALRYVIELVAPAFSSELRKDLYPVVAELQARLGKVQDHVAARQRFEMWADNEGQDNARLILEELVAGESRRMNEEVQEFHHWWDDDGIDRVRKILQLPSDIRFKAGCKNEAVTTSSQS